MNAVASIPRSLTRTSLLICALFVFGFAACESDPTPPEIADENPDSVALSGGSITQSFGFTSTILLQYPPSLLGQELLWHREGADIFNQNYVPPSAPFNFGLGPVYIEESCYSCHINAGRGAPIGEPNRQLGMMLHISRTGTGPFNGPDTVPGYGVVLQQFAVIGQKPEGDINFSYQNLGGSHGDGESYTLRKPTYSVVRTYTGSAMPSGTQYSARIASPLIGLGLLENVPESVILEYEDEFDNNSDGISGRANRVQDVITNGISLGRFGWKAGIATVMEQVAFNFNQAMGVTSTLGIYARESCIGQPQATGALFDDPEIQADENLRPVTTFLKTTAVPGRRNMNDQTVRRGQKLFTDGGCALCHRPRMRTGGTDDITILRNQTFYPYTDLLLHDMGDGLADNRPEFKADGREWRTAPLWAIGLTDVINGNNFYLHDGRARSLQEAILWHGGEAESSKDFYVKLPKSDRDALIAFLRSL